MPDIPEAAVTAAAEALNRESAAVGMGEMTAYFERIARSALDAAAPVLAEAVAQKILAHMKEHGPGPASPGVTLRETIRRAWRRHFGIAARVAAGAFDTREDQLRLAAEAIGRGDFTACDIPEAPREVREDEGP